MFTRNVLSTGRVMLTCNAVLTWVGRVHRPEYPVYMAHHLVDRVLSCWQDACHVTKTIIAVDKVWWCQQDILPCWQVMMPVDKTLPCWNGMYFADVPCCHPLGPGRARGKGASNKDPTSPKIGILAPTVQMYLNCCTRRMLFPCSFTNEIQC